MVVLIPPYIVRRPSPFILLLSKKAFHHQEGTFGFESDKKQTSLLNNGILKPCSCIFLQVSLDQSTLVRVEVRKVLKFFSQSFNFVSQAKSISCTISFQPNIFKANPLSRLQKVQAQQHQASKLAEKNSRLLKTNFCSIFLQIRKYLSGDHSTQSIVQVSVSAGLEHPFFVFGRGWSSCSPELSMTK